jgi:ribokinase
VAALGEDGYDAMPAPPHSPSPRSARLTAPAIRGPGDAARAAAAILGQGPALVALAVGDAGNYFAWRDPVWGTGELLLPLARIPVTDTTGAGDAFTAALITGLDQLRDPEEAARLAVAAAGLTAGHPGGRPELSWARLKEQLAGR